MSDEVRTQLEAYTDRLAELGGFFDFDSKQERLNQLEARMAEPAFWTTGTRRAR